MKRIAILGLGLIGSSFALACKKYLKNIEIIAWGRNKTRLKKAKRLGFIDFYTTELKDLSGVQVFFIALPVSLIAPAIKKLIPHLLKESLIIDAGSTKENIIKTLKDSGKNINFVPCHPLAGNEKKGFENSHPDLFKNSFVILTPTKYTDKKSIALTKSLWKKLGAQTLSLSPGQHDFYLALTSHLPHLLSFAFLLTYEKYHKKRPHLSYLTSNSFKDFTRIAKSSPEIWSDIFVENKKNILIMLKNFKTFLYRCERQIQLGHKKNLCNIFKKKTSESHKMKRASF